MTENMVQGSVKLAMKDAGASSSDLWKVPVDSIHVMPGYNIRIRNEAYEQRVREIADSIKANGFLVDRPLSGYIRKTDGGSAEIVLIGGHRRYEAVKIAIAEGCEINLVPMIVKPQGTSMEDLLVDLKVGNDGEPITLLEQAMLCQRLVKFGWEPPTIAGRLGYQTGTVVSLLSLAGAPLRIRDLVASDRISATLAISLLAKHGSKAVEVIERLVEGKAKATPRDVPEIRFKQHLRKQAEPMYRAIQAVQDDPGFASLSSETRQTLIQLLTKEETTKEAK